MIGNNSPVPLEFDSVQALTTKLMKSRHYALMGEAGIHMILAQAAALKMDWITALNAGFYVVQGRVGMSAHCMGGLIRRAGHSIQKDPSSNKECIILHGRRKDNGDTWTVSFSKDDAVTAGLWNSATWKKYPESMLYARALSKLFRELFPDLSLGCGYCEEEIDQIVDDMKKEGKLEEVPYEEVVEDVPQITHNSQQKITDAQVDQMLKMMEGYPNVFTKVMSALQHKRGIEYLYEMTIDYHEDVLKYIVKLIGEENAKSTDAATI